MPSRYINNTVFLAKIETTAGTDAVPTGAADAVMVGGDITITPLDANNIELDRITGYFGANPNLVGPATVKATVSVDLAGSGTAGTAPHWGSRLLVASAMAEASLTTPTRIEYTPVSTSLKTLTCYYYDDGVLHKLLGAMSNVKFTAKVGEAPKVTFDITGLDGGVSATANATPTLTPYKLPVPVTKPNVVDFSLGATYAAGVITLGTGYASTGLELDFGNEVVYVPTLSAERVDIVERKVTGKVTFDLTAAQEVTLMGLVKANTLSGVGFTLGTVAGNKLLIHAPSVQLLNPRKSDLQKSRSVDFDLTFLPVAGNDEIRMVWL